YRSSRVWSQRDIAFCQTIASQAAMAVRNAQLYEGLQEQADRDSLTDLLNHRAFYQRLGQELSRAQRDGTRVGVITLDLDNFKALNDSGGHLGGDEFALILPGVGDEIELVGRRVLAAITSKAGAGASLGITIAEP